MPYPPPATPASSSPLRALVGGLVLFNLLVAGLAGWTLARSHRQHVERAEVTTQNLAQVLEGSLVSTIHQVDLVLQTIADEAKRQDIRPDQRDLLSHIQSNFKRISLLDTLRTTDAEGWPGQAGNPKAGPDIHLVDHPFFRHLKGHPQAGLFISRPSRDGQNGAWVLTLARRLEKDNGDFLGTVFATITLERLTQELAQVDIGTHGSISLRGADLELLGRYPSPEGQALAIGDDRITGDYLAAVRTHRTVSHFTTHSVLDGETRTYTFHRVADPRFYILVGLAQSEYLQGWYQEAVLSGAAVLALLALSSGSAGLAMVAWRRQQIARGLLEQQEAKFRLITENALDVIWTADAAGRLTYISPSIHSQRGFKPEELLGSTFYDPDRQGQGAQPLRALLERVQAASTGIQRFESEQCELDLPRKDGQLIRAEVRVRALWDDHGHFLGFHGVTRDITERARLAAERDHLITQLTQALSEIKSLSGLLPICANCKKVRDDRGYWNSIESYLSDHTEATFTHGVCPDCAQELRSEMLERRARKPPSEAS